MSNTIQGLLCSCKWGEECVKLHKKFKEISDPRGKDPIRLDLSGQKEVQKMWRKAVACNLGKKEEDIKNVKQTVVYRHHWSLKQLEFFLMDRRKIGPPLQLDILICPK